MLSVIVAAGVGEHTAKRSVFPFIATRRLALNIYPAASQVIARSTRPLLDGSGRLVGVGLHLLEGTGGASQPGGMDRSTQESARRSPLQHSALAAHPQQLFTPNGPKWPSTVTFHKHIHTRHYRPPPPSTSTPLSSLGPQNIWSKYPTNATGLQNTQKPLIAQFPIGLHAKLDWSWPSCIIADTSTIRLLTRH